MTTLFTKWKRFFSKGNINQQLKVVAPPKNLGIHIEHGDALVKELYQALGNEFSEKIKVRFLQEHPNWTNYQFDWAFFELKRYFIMNKILRSVPMFSKTVDEVWHEMLMWTREYEAFSKTFYLDMLHHIPNINNKPIPGERGFFDWIYLQLFESTPNSRLLWGGFFQHPIKKEILNDFRMLSEEELLNRYFRHNGEWMNMKRGLIKKLKQQMEEAHLVDGDRPFINSSVTSEATLYQYALFPAVYFSLFHVRNFQQAMSQAMPDKLYGKVHRDTSSACSGFACASMISDGKDASNGSDGADSAGSGDSGGSCSSCGGGCSS
ncbi:hypothetical protein [Bacillus kwashiorkori]|uniref:hypothetical protein n=1 Tax=Bacillus kwashiorkori TaxID=1522318 RepID=UPI000785827E|nr:hypothetical protein [Bacillus kwashiorkori]